MDNTGQALAGACLKHRLHSLDINPKIGPRVLFGLSNAWHCCEMNEHVWAEIADAFGQ